MPLQVIAPMEVEMSDFAPGGIARRVRWPVPVDYVTGGDGRFIPYVPAELREVYEAPENKTCKNRHVYGAGEKVVFRVSPRLDEVEFKTRKLDCGDTWSGYELTMPSRAIRNRNMERRQIGLEASVNMKWFSIVFFFCGIAVCFHLRNDRPEQEVDGNSAVGQMMRNETWHGDLLHAPASEAMDEAAVKRLTAVYADLALAYSQRNGGTLEYWLPKLPAEVAKIPNDVF